MQGYLVNEDGEDIRKVLLHNGFARLSKDAMSTVSTKEFMELKECAQKAMEEGKGLWKDQKPTALKTYTPNQK